MKSLTVVALFCLIAVISAKKQYDENVDVVEPETKVHSMKKYTKEHSKEHQKSHHHGRKHKMLEPEEELLNESEPQPKKAPVEIPEPEIKLQENLETSRKAVADEKHKEQVQDLHLQDLTYEESLKKEKKKGHHHGAHRAEILEKNDEKAEKKLFAEQEAKHSVDEKVIEDSFEPIPESTEGGKNKKSKDKKNKDKSKNKKKAYEKSKDGKKSKENKKSKDGKKNKDKKYKNKDKKY